MHLQRVAMGRAAALRRALPAKRAAGALRAAAASAGARRGPAPTACLRPSDSDAPGAPFTITTPLYYVNAGAFVAPLRVPADWRFTAAALVA